MTENSPNSTKQSVADIKIPKHLIYIIDDLNVGGAQVHLVRLVALMRKCFSLEIICLGPKSDKLMEQLPQDVKVTFFDMSSIRKFLVFLFNFMCLVVHLRRSKTQLVHTYLNTANVFGLIASRLAGIQRVVTSRRDMGYFRTGRLAIVESFLSRYMARRVFCVCQAVAAATEKQEEISSSKLLVLLNGIDTEKYQLASPKICGEKIVFSMVAAMNREMKGHLDLIRAIDKAIESQAQNFIFKLVGDGPLRESIEAEVIRLNLSKYVDFVGEQANVIPLLQVSDVLVVPSHTEGISNAILEAMAMGLPVIATAVDGNCEVVIDNENGFLVPVQDSKAMAGAISAYHDDRSLIRVHGDNARKHVEAHFSLQSMQKNYIIAYNEVLQ